MVKITYGKSNFIETEKIRRRIRIKIKTASRQKVIGKPKSREENNRKPQEVNY